MATLIPPTPAANKSTEPHQEISEQNSFNHLLYKVLRLTSEQVQDLNGWMEHQGIPKVHEVIAQNFHKPHGLEDNLKLITQGKHMLHSVQCDDLLVLDDHIHHALSVLNQKQVFWTILLHPDQSSRL